MIKQQVNKVKLRIPAAKASPSPPVGPMLGQAGINIMEFCKDFNNKTKNVKEGIHVPVHIKVFSDKTFTYSIRSPGTSTMIKEILESSPNKENKFKCLSTKQVYEIAKIKQLDDACKHIELKSLCSNIIGTAKSMGITIVKK